MQHSKHSASRLEHSYVWLEFSSFAVPTRNTAFFFLFIPTPTSKAKANIPKVPGSGSSVAAMGFPFAS